jgi:hypothetical protein
MQATSNCQKCQNCQRIQIEKQNLTADERGSGDIAGIARNRNVIAVIGKPYR